MGYDGIIFHCSNDLWIMLVSLAEAKSAGFSILKITWLHVFRLYQQLIGIMMNQRRHAVLTRVITETDSPVTWSRTIHYCFLSSWTSSTAVLTIMNSPSYTILMIDHHVSSTPKFILIILYKYSTMAQLLLLMNHWLSINVHLKELFANITSFSMMIKHKQFLLTMDSLFHCNLHKSSCYAVPVIVVFPL